jgi:hypothetical protein
MEIISAVFLWGLYGQASKEFQTMPWNGWKSGTSSTMKVGVRRAFCLAEGWVSPLWFDRLGCSGCDGR